MGQSAAQSNQSLGQNFSGAITSINQNKSQALGSSYINQGNIWGNYAADLGGKVDRSAMRLFGMG